MAGRQQEAPPWTNAAPVGVAWPLASWQVWLSWQPAHPQTSDLEVQSIVCVSVNWVDLSFYIYSTSQKFVQLNEKVCPNF